MSQKTNRYIAKETLFSNSSTLIQRAIRECDGATVILKSLVASYPTQAQLRHFLFACDVSKKFDHPNILKVLDYQEQNNSPFMVLEDHQSIDLRQYTQQQVGKCLPIGDFLSIAVQLAEALSVIHHAHVIHKDLHPGNLLINPQTLKVQVSDFGLASILTREQPALASPDRLEGLLPYISPEQTGRMNRALDYRTDFYTLGVTFYELLSGQLPFSASDALGMVHAHIAKAHKPLNQVVKDIPEMVSKLIDKLLNKSAEERYQSAQGLKADLEKCLKAYQQGEHIGSFELAETDVSDRFQISQKLYGRSAEVNILLSHFSKVTDGQPQLLSVSGYSGVGKSVLINEVHKPIAANNGLFLSGKFDQFKRSTPYSAFKQALKTWLQKILSLPEHQLAAYRENLNEMLGVNARVLIDIMAEFKPLLGELPEVPVLGADETQNRLNLVLLKLVSFVAGGRPLVICIDDLQWADRSSLNLLPLLMREADCALLIIVAYRDNEVDETHPAIQTLNAMRDQKPESISELNLAPLSIADSQQLLIDSLHCSVQNAQSLVELIHQKTGGNPFFINEFLKTLYSENLLNFDLKMRCWHWDTNAIVAKGITDNVVELMLRKMQQLPHDTQRMLQLASCIGSCFEVEVLSVVAEQLDDDIVRILWPAIQEGLVLEERTLPHWAEKKASKLSAIDETSIAQFKFLHDRMLQAAYESMSTSEQQQAHLKIGRLLRNRYLHEQTSTNESQATSLFSIVEQLNHGRSLILDGAEQLFLAELNQQASSMAKSSGAWDAVVRYSEIGMSLLPSKSWQACYQLTFDLLQLKAEGEYLCGHPEASDRLYSELLNYCHDEILKAEIYATRSIESSGRGLWQAAIEFGLQGLEILGMPLLGSLNEATTDNECLNKVEEVSDALLVKEQAVFDQQTKQTPIDQIDRLPEMSSSRKLTAINILSTLTACAYLLGNSALMRLSVLRGLNLVLRAGKSDLAGNQLSWFSVLLVQNRDYLRATTVAAQAIRLLEYYPHAQELAGSYNILAGLVLPTKETYTGCIKQHHKAYDIGLESGEIARGVISLNNTLFLNYSAGKTLSSIQSQALDVTNINSRKKVFAPQSVTVLTLTNALIKPSEKAARSFEVLYSPALLKKIKGSLHEYNLLHYRSELAFWYGDTKKSLEIAREAHVGFNKTARFCLYMDHLLQYGLMLFAHDSSRLDGVTLLAEDSAWSEAGRRFCLEELKTLAALCPENFDHKFQLLLAEQGQFQKLPMVNVATHYKNAIESAKANGFIQYQALANELFALYLNRLGLDDVATAYLDEAVFLYRRWGCTARIQYLQKNYAHLLSFVETIDDGGEDESEVVSSSSAGSTLLSSDLTIDSQSSDESGLDFESVMKSSQIIASELKLTALVQKMMGILTESAGAQTAALVLNTSKGPCVQARVSALDGEAMTSSHLEQNASEMLEQCLDLPLSIISYSLRTGEVVNIEDVTNSSNFGNDPYLQCQLPQSILCVPMNYREKTMGVLYLENKLTSKAFTKSRLAIIKMLLSQAAISIENARLFEEVNLLTQGLEQQVVERTEALSESNEALQAANEELNAFSYSVSHDLRSPLRTMKGFSQILLTEYSDTLDGMGLRLLQRIKVGSSKMGELINGLLELSRVQGQDLELNPVNLSDMAKGIVNELNENNAGRTIEFICEPDITAQGDERMLSSVMVNLLNNAWKYSAKKEQATVEFGHEKQKGKRVYFVKDNGAGFDMEKAGTLFGTFQRMHTEKEFSGTGIGLATVKRIINRHKGEIWAEAQKGKGATFYFTL